MNPWIKMWTKGGTPRRRSGFAAGARTGAALVLLAAALALPGCNVVGVIAEVVAGGEKTVQIQAQYTGLAGQRIAVVVAADEFILYQHPDLPATLAKAIAGQIAQHVKGAQFLDPAVVQRFQKENPYWTSRPHGELLQRLDVDRVVLIELSEYRLHDPGNAAVWNGVASGITEVYSNTQADPDDAVFRANTRSRYPEKESIGVINSDEQTMRLGLIAGFTRDVARLFYDHEVVVQ